VLVAGSFVRPAPQPAVEVGVAPSDELALDEAA